MMNLLRRISLQERQERVSLGRFGFSMATLDSGNGRSGNWLGGIVSGEFRSEVGGEGGSLRWAGSGELFYGADVVIGSLEERNKISE